MKKYLLVLFVITTSFCRAQSPILWGLTNGNAFKMTSAGSMTGVGPLLTNAYGSFIKANNGLLYGMDLQGGEGWGKIFSYDPISNIYNILYIFPGNGYDGNNPNGSLIQADDGLLYGLTAAGGAYEDGTLFSFNISTDSLTTLYSFSGGPNDGLYPQGSLVQASEGWLWGTTSNGGQYGNGTIFSYLINGGGGVTIQYSFGTQAGDGAIPNGNLFYAGNGLYYGLTSSGGLYGSGTIFSFKDFSGVGGPETKLYDFGSGTDGSTPDGSFMMANNGLLYAMTYSGGTNNDGIILSYDTTTRKETDLYNFGGNPDGANPVGSLIQASDGLLYGMTSGGGTDSGTVFNYTISTNKETVLNHFTNNPGYAPHGDLLEDDTTVSTVVNQLNFNSNQLSIYPNPSSDYIHTTIQLTQPSNLQLRLVNILGQTLWVTNAGTVSKYQTDISVANLPGGVYLLEMVTNGGTEAREVVVARQ